MNFFKSVFSDEPDPPDPSAASAATWDFGGLLKTISEKSESVIDTYRRDLQEFGTGLRKEIEDAQGSLEGVGQVFDDLGSSVLKGTAQIINQGKDAILAADALVKSDHSDHPSPAASASNPSYKVYSRFETQVRALQGDAGTFGEEPEDAEDYSAWKLGFDLGAKRGEIENLVETNEEMMGIYERLVPGKIDDGTFWLRYFYRVHKLEQAESLRANLVKRAISSEEEELSWDVHDDDDDGEEEEEEEEEEENEKDDKGVKLSEKGGDSSGVAMVECSLNKATIPPSSVAEVEDEDGGAAVTRGEVDTVNADKPKENVASSNGREHSVVEPVKETGIEGNADKETDLGASAKHSEKDSSQNANSAKKSGKESDSEVLTSWPIGSEEEDLGWDEIEDLSSIDDNGTTKVGQGGDSSPNREELRKRLSAADEEEDLSWDIEDDEEPAKA